MVKQQLPTLRSWVRFPSFAPYLRKRTLISRVLFGKRRMMGGAPPSGGANCRRQSGEQQKRLRDKRLLLKVLTFFVLYLLAFPSSHFVCFFIIRSLQKRDHSYSFSRYEKNIIVCHFAILILCVFFVTIVSTRARGRQIWTRSSPKSTARSIWNWR